MAGDEIAQVRELAAYVWARSIAQEMLLRTLWAELAIKNRAGDPVGFVFEAIEGMIGSMDKIGTAFGTPGEGVLIDTAVQELRLVAEQVQVRLGNLGYPLPAGDAPGPA